MKNSARLSVITSSQNSHVKRWRKLLESRGIDQFGQCLVSGERLVREILVAHPNRCLEMICPPKGKASLSHPSDLNLYEIAQPLFAQLDLFGTGFPLLVCRVETISKINLDSPPVGLELLCPLGDPANVGAVVRTAVAMEVNKVILLKESANPFHPKAIRAGSGAMFSAAFYRGPSLKDLSLRGPVVGLDFNGTPLSRISWPKHVRMVSGEEGRGVSHLNLQHTATIPISDSVDSLNAAVAVGMALYAYRLQHPT